jgi:hypothetical protein
MEGDVRRAAGNATRSAKHGKEAKVAATGRDTDDENGEEDQKGSAAAQKNAPLQKRKRKAAVAFEDEDDGDDAAEDSADDADDARTDDDNTDETAARDLPGKILNALRGRMQLAVGKAGWAKLKRVPVLRAADLKKPLSEADFKGAPFVLVDLPDVEGTSSSQLTPQQLLGELRLDQAIGEDYKQQSFHGTAFREAKQPRPEKLSDEQAIRKRLLQFESDPEALLDRSDSLHLPFLHSQNYGKAALSKLLPIGQAVEQALGFSSCTR